MNEEELLITTELTLSPDEGVGPSRAVNIKVMKYDDDTEETVVVGTMSGTLILHYDFDEHDYAVNDIADSIGEDEWRMMKGFNPDELQDPEMTSKVLMIVEIDLPNEYCLPAMKDINDFFEYIMGTVITVEDKNGVDWTQGGFIKFKGIPLYFRSCDYTYP